MFIDFISYQTLIILGTDRETFDKGDTAVPSNDVPMYINVGGPSPEYENVDEPGFELPTTFYSSTSLVTLPTTTEVIIKI